MEGGGAHRERRRREALLGGAASSLIRGEGSPLDPHLPVTTSCMEHNYYKRARWTHVDNRAVGKQVCIYRSINNLTLR